MGGDLNVPDAILIHSFTIWSITIKKSCQRKYIKKYTVAVIYEIHQIHITYYGISSYINDVVIVTLKYTVCSQHVSG